MCLIIVKPKGVPYTEEISEAILNGSAYNNDGFGYALKKSNPDSPANNKSLIVVDKGYFEEKFFVNVLESMDIDENDELLIHLRMGTHGGISEANCHPFPVSTLDAELSASKCTTYKPVVAHNGVFEGYERNGDKSDTYLFVKEKLTDDATFKALIDNESFNAVAVRKIIGYGNKLAIMQSENDRPIQLLGSGWIEDSGVFYSNSGYKTSYGSRNRKSKELSDQYCAWEGCGY